MNTEVKPDNFSTKDYWILIDDKSVGIGEQKSGDNLKQHIVIPKKDFDKLIEFYNKNFL